MLKKLVNQKSKLIEAREIITQQAVTYLDTNKAQLMKK